MPHKDPTARAAYLRAWKRANSESVARRRADDDRVRHANRRAELYGAPGRLGIDDIRAVLVGASCIFCGTTDELGVDHRVPLSRGGSNSRDNLVPCCRTCNKRKHVKTRPDAWAASSDRCLDCGTQERRHVAKGLCNACYLRRRSKSTLQGSAA